MKFLRSAPGEEPINVSGSFDVSAKRLFAAWTKPEQLIKWFGPSPNSLVEANIDLTVNGDWRFVIEASETKREHLEGQYLEIEPDAKLVFSWRHVVHLAEGEAKITDYSKVTVRFIDQGEKTQLELCHEAINAEPGRLGVGGGWQRCFEQIESMFEL